MPGWGDPGRAAELFSKAVLVRRRWTPPAEALRERLLLVFFQAAAGRPRYARETFAEIEAQATAADLATSVLYPWARARLAAGEGDREDTERLLAEALRRALAAGAPGEAAAAVFHLAVLAADAGDGAALAALAEGMEPLLAPGALPAELRDRLQRFRAALHSPELTAERAVGLLRRFKEALPIAPGPFQGLLVLFDESLTDPVRRRRAKVLLFARRIARSGRLRSRRKKS